MEDYLKILISGLRRIADELEKSSGAQTALPLMQSDMQYSEYVFMATRICEEHPAQVSRDFMRNILEFYKTTKHLSDRQRASIKTTYDAMLLTAGLLPR